MVTLITDEGPLEIDDAIADKSTYMRGARSFSLTQGGTNEVDVTGLNIPRLHNYISYLEGGNFDITDDHDINLFSFMGDHHDTSQIHGYRELLLVDRICEDIMDT